MIVKLDCGCTIDDAHVSTVHEIGGGHYPLGEGPASFCRMCDLHRPCFCDVSQRAEQRALTVLGVAGLLLAGAVLLLIVVTHLR